MPATQGRKPSQNSVLGVDGCRGGWVVARRDIPTGNLVLSVEPDFRAVLKAGEKARAIIVDMPIGLAQSGRRDCEQQTRAFLRPSRSSSVFAAPRRPMLAFANYADANSWGKRLGPEGGGGLSKQAWHLIPKIREVDKAISVEHQGWLGEGHPEAAFARLNGRACVHSKRTREGREERTSILRRHGVADPDGLIAAAGRLAKADDVLDAIALSLTAEARLQGKATRFTDEARDARGLVMEIWA